MTKLVLLSMTNFWRTEPQKGTTPTVGVVPRAVDGSPESGHRSEDRKTALGQSSSNSKGQVSWELSTMKSIPQRRPPECGGPAVWNNHKAPASSLESLPSAGALDAGLAVPLLQVHFGRKGKRSKGRAGSQALPSSSNALAAGTWMSHSVVLAMSWRSPRKK